MGKSDQFDFGPTPATAPPAEKRTRDEVLRDVRLAIAQSNNYGRKSRRPGANPYDSQLGRPQRDVWGNHKRPT
jgi:hypothetical protein